MNYANSFIVLLKANLMKFNSHILQRELILLETEVQNIQTRIKKIKKEIGLTINTA